MKRVAFLLSMFVPLGLLYGRAGADIGISLTDLCFIAYSAKTRQWHWARAPWFVICLCWWLDEVICSLPIADGKTAWPAFIQAIVLIRLPLFAVSLGYWVLNQPRERHHFWLAIAAAQAWIAIECWQQEIFGVNLFGDHRWPDGALTGPFWGPRAGPPFSHLLLPVLLPLAAALAARRTPAARLCAAVLAVAGLTTVLLIGQRMPFLLAGLGLVVAMLLFRPIRIPALGLGALMVLAVPTLPLLSPLSYRKLVIETAIQSRHFIKTPYGELFTRAIVMIRRAPWTGYGFDGFLNFCREARFGGGLPSLGIGPTSLHRGACNIHPHNFYLQAGVNAGIPGLLLFAALNAAWLIAIRPAITEPHYPLKLGLFIGVLTFSWPLASTGDFAVLPMAGWLYVILGLALAYKPTHGIRLQDLSERRISNREPLTAQSDASQQGSVAATGKIPGPGFLGDDICSVAEPIRFTGSGMTF